MNRWGSALFIAVVLGVSIAAAGAMIGRGLYEFRMADRTLVIKGLAERTVDSDFATWPLTVRRAGDSFAGVQQALASDRDQVVTFLTGLGFSPAEIEVRPLVVNDVFSREYAPVNTPTRYNGSALVVVKSARVDAVQSAALATDPLIAAGVQLDAGAGPQYELRGFNEVKGDLLKAATENAATQARRFAEEANASLGVLKRANQGVIQISGTAGNSYDSSGSREKRLRVVSTFEYYLR